ncbi:MAG: HD-GYP domain-containing protein [Deltaproteobacteria bacterium]|nr:HD-GYP domain-containing protein [Deltaproteobacteria bacterium]
MRVVSLKNAGPLLDDKTRQWIRVLMEALKLKDPYTFFHSVRVSEYALMMGRNLNVSSTEMVSLELGALLHDLGKIGVPDHILKKEGALTEQEFEWMKKHPVMSAQVIGHCQWLKDVVPIVKHHHERIDGLGYPEGLKGEAISPLTRAVFIVDAFDAMTSDRPYRKALSFEVAYQELERCAGTQFDATLVEIFIHEHQQQKYKLEKSRFVDFIDDNPALQKKAV